jgi:hypothetical protein
LDAKKLCLDAYSSAWLIPATLRRREAAAFALRFHFLFGIDVFDGRGFASTF